MAHRFEFRLEAVLRYRRMIENLRKKEFGLARQATARQSGRIVALLTEEGEGRRMLVRIQTGDLDVELWKLTQGYLQGLALRLRRAYEQLHRLQQVEDQRRGELVEATRGVRVLERLRERRLEQWRYEAGREEQKALDEAGRRPLLRAEGSR